MLYRFCALCSLLIDYEAGVIGAERQNRILEAVKRAGIASVKDLADMFGVSVMTMRRDLADLARQGLVDRIYGGARAVPTDNRDVPFSKRQMELRAEKAAIARAAAELVSDGETIAIDAGTTIALFCREIRDRRLTVITNSVRVMDDLSDAPDITVVCTGGILTDAWPGGDRVFVGPLAESALRRFRPAKAFIGTAGITVEDGLTNSNSMQAEIKRVMMQVSHRVYLLADHTKFGHVSYAVAGDLSRITAVITDSGLSEQWQAAMRDAAVDVILATAHVREAEARFPAE